MCVGGGVTSTRLRIRLEREVEFLPDRALYTTSLFQIQCLSAGVLMCAVADSKRLQPPVMASRGLSRTKGWLETVRLRDLVELYARWFSDHQAAHFKAPSDPAQKPSGVCEFPWWPSNGRATEHGRPED